MSVRDVCIKGTPRGEYFPTFFTFIVFYPSVCKGITGRYFLTLLPLVQSSSFSSVVVVVVVQMLYKEHNVIFNITAHAPGLCTSDKSSKESRLLGSILCLTK